MVASIRVVKPRRKECQALRQTRTPQIQILPPQCGTTNLTAYAHAHTHIYSTNLVSKLDLNLGFICATHSYVSFIGIIRNSLFSVYYPKGAAGGQKRRGCKNPSLFQINSPMITSFQVWISILFLLLSRFGFIHTSETKRKKATHVFFSLVFFPSFPLSPAHDKVIYVLYDTIQAGWLFLTIGFPFLHVVGPASVWEKCAENVWCVWCGKHNLTYWGLWLYVHVEYEVRCTYVYSRQGFFRKGKNFYK